MKLLLKVKYLATIITLFSVVTVSSQTSSKYKVTLDAGHGAHDFGATYHGFVEKNITLAIVLKLGKILEQDPSIQVNYTRNNDTFVDLVERANIANRVDAHLFISIHCNANKKQEPYGAETFVMGLGKSASSLEVAKKENAVITLEADYKTKYAGYNPNSPESLISATIAQEENLELSIELAKAALEGFNITYKDLNEQQQHEVDKRIELETAIAKATTAPCSKLNAPQTTGAMVFLPSNNSTTLRRSAFGCFSTFVTLATMILSNVFLLPNSCLSQEEKFIKITGR